MVIGTPNTGKSAFINKFAGRSAMIVGNKAGVTRQNQWIRVRHLNQNFDLLDTPGILPPKFDSHEIGLKLAAIGCIKDDILDRIEIASFICGVVYKIDDFNEKYDKLLEIGKQNGCIIKGGIVDEERAARVVITEFRAGKLGKFCLE